MIFFVIAQFKVIKHAIKELKTFRLIYSIVKQFILLHFDLFCKIKDKKKYHKEYSYNVAPSSDKLFFSNKKLVLGIK